MTAYKCEMLKSGKVSENSDYIETWVVEATKGKSSLKGAVEYLLQTEFMEKGRTMPIAYKDWMGGIVVSEKKPQGYDYASAYRHPYYKASKTDSGDDKARYTVKVVTPYIKTEGVE